MSNHFIIHLKLCKWFLLLFFISRITLANFIPDCLGINPHILAILAKLLSVLLQPKHISLSSVQFFFYSFQCVCTIGHFVKWLISQSVCGMNLMEIVLILTPFVIWYVFTCPSKSKWNEIIYELIASLIETFTKYLHLNSCFLESDEIYRSFLIVQLTIWVFGVSVVALFLDMVSY